MAHKDRVTGVMVADIFEVITPDQMQSIFVDMAEEDDKQSKDMIENPKIVYDILLMYHKYYNRDFYPLKIFRVLEAHNRTMIREYRTEVVADILVFEDAFKRGIMRLTLQHYSSTMEEPEDEDMEVEFLKCDDCQVFGKMRYSCWTCPHNNKAI